MDDAAKGPLDGFTVLDMSRVLAGPYCTMLLADMGARVVKIEQPGRGDETRTWGPPFVAGESAYFLSVNRNKESVTLDFKDSEGRALLDALLAKADIVVENFQPGTLARLGLDYASVRATYPRLVYCSISGFGQTGPRRGEPGYDAVIQAESGLMSITGDAAGPPFRLGVAIADLVAGLLAAQGITLALLVRERTGRGQHVDIGLLDAAASLLIYHAQRYLAKGQVSGRLGNRHLSIAPYDIFDAADGELVLAVGNDDQFRRFCDAAGVGELASDERFATNPERVRNNQTLRDVLKDPLGRKTRDEWIALLRESGVPCGSVRDIGEALNDPQLVAREMIAAVEHASAGTLKILGVPIKLSDTPGTVRTAPPTLGQHTDRVLQDDLGLDTARIARLHTAKVI
jgi:crotonobetainyl-CoA:carnitine CoA-transferase CaiB-like acyl-CoA transferase